MGVEDEAPYLSAYLLIRWMFLLSVDKIKWRLLLKTAWYAGNETCLRNKAICHVDVFGKFKSVNFMENQPSRRSYAEKNNKSTLKKIFF